MRGASIEVNGLERAAAPAAKPLDVVINATSLGHEGTAPAVHPSWYSGRSVASELAYNPPVSPFMTFASEAGARAENGLGMLVYQGILAFEEWTGQVPPTSICEQALLDALKARETGGVPA